MRPRHAMKGNRMPLQVRLSRLHRRLVKAASGDESLILLANEFESLMSCIRESAEIDPSGDDRIRSRSCIVCSTRGTLGYVVDRGGVSLECSDCGVRGPRADSHVGAVSNWVRMSWHG